MPNIYSVLLKAPLLFACVLYMSVFSNPAAVLAVDLDWRIISELPDNSGGEGYPGNIGVAGAYTGVHNDALIVAGGANFPIAKGSELWSEDTLKTFHQSIWVATRTQNKQLNWLPVKTKLPSAMAYGVSVESGLGVFVLGGTDGKKKYAEAYLLRWLPQEQRLERLSLPKVPMSGGFVNGAAAIIGHHLYLMVGEDKNGVSEKFFQLDLSKILRDEKKQIVVEEGRVRFVASDDSPWQLLPALPEYKGKSMARSHMILLNQKGSRDENLYLVGGRRVVDPAEYPNAIPVGLAEQRHYWHIFNDTWLFSPKTKQWQRKRDIEVSGKALGLSAGTGVAIGQSHLLILSGSNGDHLREAFGKRNVNWSAYPGHSGFYPHALSYNTITDRWARYNAAPKVDDFYPDVDDHKVSLNAVSTRAVKWNEDIILASGEIRPKVRSPYIVQVKVKSDKKYFGWVNMSVLILYLLAMVAVGFYFMRKNKNTDDFFRGGQHIPWWAAACSIYATMLSSLTYVALPALVYRTDWLVFLGIPMILVAAPIAVYFVMPFFRKIDATSAYEYLSLRFNMPVRLLASGLFSLFHISRMGIVMALTSLALAAVTPLDAWQCVLIMGLLCIAYSTLGGVEAVIWTDTVQTIVLVLGAIVCVVFLMAGIEGGFSAFVEKGLADNKFRMVDIDFSADSALSLSLWVIVLGGIGQNISTYSADQAVVQRYMTTSDEKNAAKSIWANGFLAGPAALLYFLIGSGLYYFYQAQPEKLDPTMKIDQIFPAFISTELPLGVAGLLIAGIFAAAQSTISTSMNATASTLVTDFVRPFFTIKNEMVYLKIARSLTVIMGCLGTLAGLLFISPEVRSLMEEYFKVIGMFMGALGGLFVLGMATKRANAWGAFSGLVIAVLVMIVFWQKQWANGYLFATIGIISCVIFGYLISVLIPSDQKNIAGLTLHDLNRT